MAQIPTLSYVGSVDTTNSPSGANMFRILFDQTITNVLMFEYQILSSTTELLPPELITTGFINPDSAQSDGIVNQWLIPVPSTGEDYVTGMVVRVRVYPSGLSVTEWSNSLNFYNPPPQPTIIYSKYDQSYTGDDELWVLLQGPAQPGIKYILAFYYSDTANDTVWQVSSVLEPSLIQFDGSQQLVVNTGLGNNVSTDPSKQLIYVAAHAVYPFTYQQDTFYTVSEISQTVTATPASYSPPVLEPLNYDYTTQDVTLTWLAPSSSFIFPYSVSTYDIYLNGSLIDSVAGNVNTYTYTNQAGCGTTLTFYVVANSAVGSVSLQSNSESVNVFYASQAPLSLSYSWAVADDYDNSVKVAFTFQNPASLGCGTEPIANWQIINTSNNDEVVESGTLEYNSTPGHVYPKIVDFPYIVGNQYRIRVFMSTLDVNAPYDRIDGATSTSSVILPVPVPIIYNIELIQNGVRFDVASNDLISPFAQLVNATYSAQTGVQINHRPFVTVNYTPTPVGNGFVYEDCQLFWADLPISPAPTHFTLAISNSSGVGIGLYQGQ